MPEERARAEGEGGGFLLGKAARLSERRFELLRRESGLPLLEPGQGRVIYLLWRHGELSQKELARLAGLDKSSLALTLDRLEEKGLVERRPDERDGRRKRVASSGASESLHAAYDRASRDMGELFYRGFSDEERVRFEASLARIIANLEAPSVKPGSSPEASPEAASSTLPLTAQKTAAQGNLDMKSQAWKGWKGSKSGD